MPSISVIVPTEVPSQMTLAPGSGRCFPCGEGSMTIPLILSCAKNKAGIKNKMMNRFFIIINLKLFLKNWGIHNDVYNILQKELDLKNNLNQIRKT